MGNPLHSSSMNWLYWALLSAVFAGITAILAKIGVKGIDSNLATAIRTSFILVFTWLIVWIKPGSTSLFELTRKTWAFLALSAVATGLSWLCYFRALQIGEASRVAPIDKLSVVFAIILAALILKEKLTWHQWVGGALICAGALVITLKPS